MSHTPGSWKVHEEGKTYPLEIFPASGGGLIAALPRKDDVGRADARLIAAAPDLLEALRAVRNDAAEFDDQISAYVMGKVEEAIAKAEGR